MPNLFWKNNKNKTVNLVEQKFKSEEEFEKYIYNNKELLNDIFIINRQIRVRGGREIPDIIGIDDDGNIIIIEMKNTIVDENILPQVLKYALWAQTNPDSIKLLWSECKDKPEDINVDWDNLSIKIIIIAPAIKQSVIRVINAINYKLELIEVKKFSLGKDEFILTNKIETEEKQRILTTRLEAWLIMMKNFIKQKETIKALMNFY